jgi:enediyne polyketide synthase
VDVPLLLGSPGLNDATLHVLQACLPHRRLLPAGCERVTFSGREVRGALQVQARRRAEGTGRPSAADGCWDVVAVDATGQPVVTWTGLRLRDVGPLARAGAWHPALLANALEARAAELGIGTSLRAVIASSRSPVAAASGHTPPATPAGAEPAGAAPAGAAGPADHTGPGTPRHEPPGWADSAPGSGPLDGFELSVSAGRPVVCRWETVSATGGGAGPRDEGLVRLRQQLDGLPREAPAVRRARYNTIVGCLEALGRKPGSLCVLEDACDGGWVTVRAVGMAVACTVTEMCGVPAPVCVAVGSRTGPAGQEWPGPPAGPGERAAMTANGPLP